MGRKSRGLRGPAFANRDTVPLHSLLFARIFPFTVTHSLLPSPESTARLPRLHHQPFVHSGQKILFSSILMHLMEKLKNTKAFLLCSRASEKEKAKSGKAGVTFSIITTHCSSPCVLTRMREACKKWYFSSRCAVETVFLLLLSV